MAQIHIHREHHLGLARARQVAFAWAEQIESELDMACVYEEGADEDTLRFSRSGVSGTLQVGKGHFELEAKLGVLVSAFKAKIEREIVRHLDTLLAPKAVAKKTASTRTAAKKTAK